MFAANLDISPRDVKIGLKALCHKALRPIAKKYNLYFRFSAVNDLNLTHMLAAGVN